MTAVAVEPELIATVLDAEHAEAAVQIGYGLHADEKPLALRLVRVLQPQLGTNFVRAEFQSERECLGDDVSPRCTLLETELTDGHVDEVNFHLRFAHREGVLAEDVVSPATDLHARTLDQCAEIVGVIRPRAELDGFSRPGSNIFGSNIRDHHESDIPTKLVIPENATKIVVIPTNREHFVGDCPEDLPGSTH